MTGAQILMECLKREGVSVVFGYPGGAVLDIYHELPRHPEIRHILVRHEQGAVHAADGYARASGEVGVALVTSGPGATNAVTGIATAYCDSIPLVVFTGQVARALIGNDAFQEVDIVGITRPCTKHNYLVERVEDLSRVIREAFHIARTGRPGPVLIDLPKDIVQAHTEFSFPDKVTLRSYNPSSRPNSGQVRRAAKLLSESKRPLLIVGGGVITSGAHEEVAQLAHTFNIPVTGTLLGLGGFSGHDPLWLGMLGMHGTVAANRAVSQSDLILAVGMRFDDRVTGKISAFASQAKIVHIDIDPSSIGKNVSVDVPIVCDCQEGLKELLAQFADGQAFAGQAAAARLESEDWRKTVTSWQTEFPLTYGHGQSIKPQHVVRLIDEITGGDALICTEVGQNQMWTAQFYRFNKPRTLLTSGGLGTMGYGLPAAIGAKVARPDKLVIDIAGDGSIQMNIQEMATAVYNDIPVKVVILNNHFLGMVRQWQELFYDRNYSFTPMEGQPDFVMLAKAFGADGYLVTREDELEATLREAFASPRAALVNVLVDKEENVFPIIPANGTLDDMMLT